LLAELSAAGLGSRQFLAAYVIGAVFGAAVFLHADRHGSRHPTVWAIITFFAAGIGVIVYFSHYYWVRRRHRS
jgi:prepilin signal peptidase PulO-like enzyme (type II secretory pathway)